MQVLASLGVDVTSLSIPTDRLPIFSHSMSIETETKNLIAAIRSQIVASDGLIVCSPQFNGSIPPFLKNLIDWISPPLHVDGNERVFKDKVVCLLGAARGQSTCLGGLAHLSSVFGYLGSVIVPQYYGISQIEKVISGTGDIVDAKIDASLKSYMNSFFSLLKRF
jgi:NAD(P)H-dependent FMN reductase